MIHPTSNDGPSTQNMTTTFAIQAELHRKQRSIAVFGTFFVVIGLALASLGVRSANLTDVGLGILITLMAVAVTVATRMMARVEVQLFAATEQLDSIRNRVEKLEAPAIRTEVPTEPEPETRMSNLASLRHGDPSLPTTATSERQTFPRLAELLHQTAPDRATPQRDELGAEFHANIGSPDDLDRSAGQATDLLNRWEMGLRNRDLSECRAVFAILAERLEPGQVSPFKAQLDDLSDETEQSLRKMFAAAARRGDCHGLLAIGDRICEVLPDRPIAADFVRIKPMLREKSAAQRDPNELTQRAGAILST